MKKLYLVFFIVLCFDLSINAADQLQNNSSEPLIKVRKNKQAEVQKELCPICFDEMSLKKVLKIFNNNNNCRHIFHEKCLKEWAQKKTNCPICRAELSRENLNKLGVDPGKSNQEKQDNLSPFFVFEEWIEGLWGYN